jgi:hypothetical protein
MARLLRPVVGPPLHWAILRFLVKGIGWRGCAALSKAGLFAIRNGARGQTGRAREELQTVWPGAATRERFLEGVGEKAFWCHGGENNRLSFRSSGGCRWCRVSAIPVRSVTRPGTRQSRPDCHNAGSSFFNRGEANQASRKVGATFMGDRFSDCMDWRGLQCANQKCRVALAEMCFRDSVLHRSRMHQNAKQAATLSSGLGDKMEEIFRIVAHGVTRFRVFLTR